MPIVSVLVSESEDRNIRAYDPSFSLGRILVPRNITPKVIVPAIHKILYQGSKRLSIENFNHQGCSAICLSGRILDGHNKYLQTYDLLRKAGENGASKFIYQVVAGMLSSALRSFRR